MKRILFLLALAAAGLAQAQLYKYVDKDGKTVYSDQPPANLESKQLNVNTGRSATSAAPAANAPKTAVERDKELEKARQESREKAAKDGKKAEENEKACAAARQAHQTYVQGGRMHKYDEKGERVILGDEEIEAEKNRTRREMEEACKKS